MGHCRDAESVGCDDALLGALQRKRSEGGVDGCGAERAGELADPVGEEIVDVDVVDHVVLVGSDFSAVGCGAYPDADELGELLFERHRLDQGVDALGSGAERIPPHAHPLTAPASPPTMRFSAKRKKARAGSIASDV